MGGEPQAVRILLPRPGPVLPWGIAPGDNFLALVAAIPLLLLKLAIGGAFLAGIETINAKMRIFRAPEFLGTAFMLAVLGLLVRLLLESRV
jgi:formate hydrogenlyase subunit 4